MNVSMTSNKPYIVRAFYDWISDNQLTPYIVVDVGVKGVSVPMAYVNDGQIVLNISSSAVGSISLAGDFIEFSARFGGRLEHLIVPYGAIAAIYAKENGAGTSLAIEDTFEESETSEGALAEVDLTDKGESDGSENPSSEKAKSRPSLTVVK